MSPIVNKIKMAPCFKKSLQILAIIVENKMYTTILTDTKIFIS